MQERLQRFGGWLAGMVIPNIGAFMAWGLITALVIPTGWLARLGFGGGQDGEVWGTVTGNLVGPMITYLLPVLVAYTGGKMVHGHRGGVLAAIAVFGVIGGRAFSLDSGASGEPPQFLGAMAIGPLAGYVMKKIDEFLEEKTPAGFEMLFNNLSQAFAGLGLTFLGYWIIGPIMRVIADVFGSAVEGISDAGLLPLADIPIEVGKVLFLNNAINHGVLTPLGAEDVAEKGRSIYFMLESNPGPGLGLLLASWFAGKGLAKLSAPGAIVIHFIGGIHEVYFPYILMNPVMIGAMWAGGITADLVFVATDAGLTGPPSPGSIIAYLTFLPPEGGAAFGVLAGVAVGAIVSFVTGVALLRMFPVKEMADTDIDEIGVGTDGMPDIPGMNIPGASA
ncbi:MAG: PTS transporter subunit EIIC [Acidimicrobiia bacterium]